MALRLRGVVPLVLFSVFVLAPQPAEAAPRTAQGDRALDLFEQSARAYREGRFQDAVDKLLEARKLKPEPVLLYNLARAYEALGRSDEAADAYAQYLAEEPAAGDRRAIEGRIATLRTQAAELAAARKPEPKKAEPEVPAPPPAPPPSPPDQGTELPAFVPWAVAGAGAAIMGTGLVLGAVANGRHDDAVAEPAQRKAVDLQESAEGLAQASTITIIAGAVVALAGIGWLVVRTTSAPRTTGMRADPLRIGWTF